MRVTDTHVFFWSGPFSNWHQGRSFEGAYAYAETVDRLDALDIRRPSDSAFGSRLLRAAAFNCGEQWMMACKAWLMATSPALVREDLDDADAARALDIERTRFSDRNALVQAQLPRTRIQDQPLVATLVNPDPRAQKAIGRSIAPYDDALWSAARVPCVVGGNIARMAADPKARRALVETGTRTLVEGSPYDRVWGVGLKFDDPAIHDPANWRGLNLLGVALGEVRTVAAARRR